MRVSPSRRILRSDSRPHANMQSSSRPRSTGRESRHNGVLHVLPRVSRGGGSKTNCWCHRSMFSSFYVTNFPEDFRSSDLWKLFQNMGRIKYVFIPLKRNKSGQRFTFIRFENVPDERKLAQTLDNTWIGNLKVFANVPRYLRTKTLLSSRVAPKVGQKVGSGLVSRVGRSYVDVFCGFRGKESPNNDHEVGFNPVLSNNVVEKDLHCSVVNDDLNWIRFCVVGRTVDTVTPSEVSELLKEVGMLSFLARPLGDNMVLLALVDGECIQEVMCELVMEGVELQGVSLGGLSGFNEVVRSSLGMFPMVQR
ncbi:unnamed protein product [Lupinus luteus]|uniref:RRM domain-containing protein n=1 Tax=Lupinus luteus TaxID=3873 RepID=A0AAV1W6L9_LUPLU